MGYVVIYAQFPKRWGAYMKFEYVQCKEDIQKYAVLPLIDKYLTGLPIFNPEVYCYGKRRSDFIPPNIIAKATSLMQSLALTSYAKIEELNSNTIFTSIVGNSISQESFRQKLDDISKTIGLDKIIDDSNIELLRSANIDTVWYAGKEYYTLDIDVTPFINEDCNKEGVSYTYKRKDGYAPIMGYLGEYGLAYDLRPGSQHSEKGAVEFLNRCISLTDRLGIQRSNILLRVDSGHDATKFINACLNLNINFILKKNIRNKNVFLREWMPYVKRNIRPEINEDNGVKIYRYIDENKPYGIKSENLKQLNVFIEEISNDNKQLRFPVLPTDDLFGREPWINYSVESYITNIKIFDNEFKECTDQNKYIIECVNIYRDHATCEQFHSEEKTDMNMELLPSKYFKTNAFILQLSVLAFNVLRILGNLALINDSSFQHHKYPIISRIRIKTVIEKICNIPCKVAKHARKIVLKIGKYCKVFKIYKKNYNL